MRTQPRQIWEQEVDGQSALEWVKDFFDKEDERLVGGSKVSDRVRMQMRLPIKMGGSTVRHIDGVLDAAFIGGWAAAFSSTIPIGALVPQWVNLNWDAVELESFRHARVVWANVLGRLEHLRVFVGALQIGGAAGLGIVAEEEGNETRALDKYHETYHKAWEADVFWATEVTEVGTSA